MAKLPPRLTSLPMAVWVAENQGFPHDVRVKVSPIHGGRGAWSAAASVAVRPQPRVVAGNLLAADLRLVSDWIVLNEATILAFWDGTIEIDELLARLQRLP